MNECSSRSDCSEIKGLEHRLFKLAQMMDESKRLATEQYNLADVYIKSIFIIKLKYNYFSVYHFYYILRLFFRL